MLVAVGGLVACGKSTTARSLAEALGAERLAADEVRAELHADGHPEAFVPGFSAEVYDELFRRAGAALEHGSPVVLDGTFRNRALRARARQLAAAHGVPFRFVECRAGEERCRERLRQRADSSAWLELFENFLPLWEPPDELPAQERVVLDTSGGPELAPDAAVLKLSGS